MRLYEQLVDMEKLQYAANQEVFGIESSYRLGTMHELSIKSFLAHGHHYTLYGVKEYDNLPEGCTYLPLKDYVPSGIYKRAVDKSKIQSRVAQFYLLYKQGGFYVEEDIVCLSDTIPSNTAYLDSTMMRSVIPEAIKLPAGTKFAYNIVRSLMQPEAIMSWDGSGTIIEKLRTPTRQTEDTVLNPVNMYAAASSFGLTPYCQHDTGPWIKDAMDYKKIWFPIHSVYKKILKRWGVSMLLHRYITENLGKDASAPAAVYEFLNRDTVFCLMRQFLSQYCPDLDKTKLAYY